MIFRSNMTIEEYRALDAVHYSQLSALSYSPNSVNEPREESDSLSLGSVVDCMVTTPTELRDKFKVLTTSEPTGQMLEFCKAKLNGKNDEESYIIAGFKRDKLETVISRYDSEGKAYVEERLDLKERNIKGISYEMYEQALSMKEKVLNHEFTKKYFDTDKYEIYYQVPIIDEVNRTSVKILLDILLVDKVTKKLIPIDLKTTSSSVFTFKGEFLKWHYYLQAALYWLVVQHKVNDDESQTYDSKVEDFKFIVVNSNPFEPPIIYNVTATDLQIGILGTENSKRSIKGVLQLIEDLKWHKEKNLWAYPREIYENEGVINLDIKEYVS